MAPFSAAYRGIRDGIFYFFVLLIQQIGDPYSDGSKKSQSRVMVTKAILHFLENWGIIWEEGRTALGFSKIPSVKGGDGWCVDKE